MDINVDKIKENIDKAAEFTVKKTGEILSITKLKIKKTEIKGKISDAYRELGETIYKNAKDENDISEKVTFIINKIDGLVAELSECNEAIDSIKE